VTGPGNTQYSFEIDAFDKERMLKGLDEIAMTQQYDNEFAAYEKAHRAEYDWL
jgi:3-isopropylmalate/(R)-2-methylmalate dehydratase small subunit